MSLKLSFLDKCPIAEGANATQALQHAVEIAQKVEALGFYRYWVAEHHLTERYASPSPELVLAWLLPQTQNIRLGSGGVMLQHYSPYKVAENFNVLATLGGQRIDLGVGKAPGGLPKSTQALQRGLHQDEKGDFRQQLQLLQQHLQARSLTEDPEHLPATPIPEQSAELFLLGASVESAILAAELNWNFVFAAHLNGNQQVLKEALAAFKQRNSHKKAIIALQIVVAETRQQAEKWAEDLSVWTLQLANGQKVKVLSEQMAHEFAEQAQSEIVSLQKEALNIVKGSAQEVRQQLSALYQQHQIDELIVEIPLSEHQQRLAALDLLADVADLAAA